MQTVSLAEYIAIAVAQWETAESEIESPQALYLLLRRLEMLGIACVLRRLAGSCLVQAIGQALHMRGTECGSFHVTPTLLPG